MEYIPSQKKSKSVGQLVFECIEKIFEISCHEFRGGYWIKKDHGNWIEEVYVPDSRKVYCQAVESLSFIIHPHYSTNMKKEMKDLDEKQEENLKKYEGEKINYEKFITKKLVLMKQVFKEINFLLKEKDYLKGETYEDIQEMLNEDEEE